MNLPQVYMCSPPWTLLPPHTIPVGRPSALEEWDPSFHIVTFQEQEGHEMVEKADL